MAAFDLLRDAGQLDLVISLGFLLLLGFVGVLMLQESLRAMVGVVTQDTSLLHRSIRDNIAQTVATLPEHHAYVARYCGAEAPKAA